MKLIKSIVMTMAAMAAMVGYAGDSAPFRLDTMEGTRVARTVETIAYSTEWDNGGKVIVSVDDVTLKEVSAPATGDVTWNARNASVGNHKLTHTTYKNGVAGKVETVTFTVKAFYTVTFNANGGSLGSDSPTRLITEGNAIGTLPTPTRTGYTFAGWWTATSGGTQISASTTVTGNVTYYAHWTVNQYTVTFNANGGSGGTTKTQNYGTSLSAPTVTRTGYTFTGWSPSVPSTMPAGNRTYYAQWQINQYTVTFNANGGIGGKTVTQNYGTSLTTPTVTREWFNFTGWSPAVAATVPANNVTYTAQWARWGDSISASKMGGKTMKQLYPSDYAYMTTMVLEEGITELPTGFFNGCGNVEFVTWPSTLVEFGIDDLPSKIRASLAYDANGFMIYGNWILDYQNRNASAVTIPEGIVGIGRGAFAEMYDLETVRMPESLRSIAERAFEGCTYILNLQFMSGLRHVGPEAFRDCSSLLRATFADGVEYIGASAFKDCWQMQSVRLPYTVTFVGDNAFSGCGNIRGVTVPTQVKTMQSLFPAAYSKIETAEVAEGETRIMADMFKGCVALRGGATQTDMSMIPNSVTNVGARAFQGCTLLTAFVVPDSVVQIGVSVFQDCTELWDVTLSRSLSAIPDYAFYGCKKLDSMDIPASVTYLGAKFYSGRTDPTLGIVVENALYYRCTNAPAYHPDAYAAIAGNVTTYVLPDSRSWDGRQGSRVLPASWNGYPITYWTANRFDVTFDANGGRFDSSGGSTWSEQQITDSKYALPSTGPTRPGWAFEGWWTEQTGGAEVRYSTVVTATRPHTLYAHWRSLGEGMTVSFNSNGGTVVTPGTQNYVPGQTFGQFPVPTRLGYTFQGWWTEAVNGIRMTEATQVPAANMELFAHWSPITYYVRFNANGGVGSPVYQPFTFDVQQALATHTFTREGFAFSGWATTPSGQVRYPENKSVVNLEEVQDEVVNLYAVWSGVGYSVRFDSNGGNGIMDNQTIRVGETQNLWPCVFARGGYTFAGWAVSPSDAEAKRVTYIDGAAVKDLATSNGAVVPLYAVWVSAGQMVRISFDANGGSVSPDYWNCNVGTAVEAFPTPTRPGFTFAGWWTVPIGGTRVSSIPNVTVSQTFYAHWTANGSVVPGNGDIIVSFNANGGSVSETTRNVSGGSAVGELPTPVRTGYSFVGWYTSALGGTKVTSETIVRSSVTYYAHWMVAWTVTLNANGGTLVGENGVAASLKLPVAKGQAVGTLPTPTRTGYAFKGWYTKKSGGTKITAKTKVTKNVTWYAQWTVKKYSVKVVKEGKGSVSGVGSKAYKSKVTLKAKAASGYVFQGWYKIVNGEEGIVNSEEGTVLVSQKATYSFKVPLDGVTYKAKFITKAEDKASIGMEFEGMGFGAMEGGGLAGREPLPVVTNTCGVVTAWPVATTGLTPVSVKVAGQPKGMKYDAKKRSITGVPSVANKSGTMKITVKSAGASMAWSVKWRTVALPAFARGTFNGWTYVAEGDGGLAGRETLPVRKVTVSVTSAGKITAKVGSYSLARTGWTAGEDGLYRATLSKTRTVGTGKKAKKYKDVMTLVLDPAAEWTEDQLVGTFTTCLATNPDAPTNADTVFSARRNPFGDNAEAKDVAAQLYAMGAKQVTDEAGLVWTVKVSASGVATISRTTGTGKKKKTVSATAVVEIARTGDDSYQAVARFLVSGKVIAVDW